MLLSLYSYKKNFNVCLVPFSEVCVYGCVPLVCLLYFDVNWQRSARSYLWKSGTRRQGVLRVQQTLRLDCCDLTMYNAMMIHALIELAVDPFDQRLIGLTILRFLLKFSKGPKCFHSIDAVGFLLCFIYRILGQIRCRGKLRLCHVADFHS